MKMAMRYMFRREEIWRGEIEKYINAVHLNQFLTEISPQDSSTDEKRSFIYIQTSSLTIVSSDEARDPTTCTPVPVACSAAIGSLRHTSQKAMIANTNLTPNCTLTISGRGLGPYANKNNY